MRDNVASDEFMHEARYLHCSYALCQCYQASLNNFWGYLGITRPCRASYGCVFWVALFFCCYRWVLGWFPLAIKGWILCAYKEKFYWCIATVVCCLNIICSPHRTPHILLLPGSLAWPGHVETRHVQVPLAWGSWKWRKLDAGGRQGLTAPDLQSRCKKAISTNRQQKKELTDRVWGGRGLPDATPEE